MKILIALLALNTVPTLAFAQEPQRAWPPSIASRGLPESLESRVTEILADSALTRFSGSAWVESNIAIEGDLAVVGGPLTVAGGITGDLVVLDGNLIFEPGASVAGDIFVIGGAVRGAENAKLGGTLTTYGRATARAYGEGDGDGAEGEPWDEAKPVDVPWDDWPADEPGWDPDDPWRGYPRDRRDREYDDGYARFSVGLSGGYNRIEGLPIRFGPGFGTGGENPLRLEVSAIARTESDLLDTDEMGYDLRLEQFLGGDREFRIGASAYSIVEPIEARSLSGLESSLYTFFVHDDPRDYYDRTGWSLFTRFTPGSLPIEASLEYRADDYDLAFVQDPFTLFGDDPWRPQPLIASGNVRSLVGRVVFDSRDDDFDGVRAWYLALTTKQGLGGNLRFPTVFPAFSSNSANALATPAVDEFFTSGLIDARLYNRLEPRGHDPLGVLALRFVAGGSVTAEPLPPQMQHALGGVGTLPGFERFALDCRARNARAVRLDSSPDATIFFPTYGCDRFLLGQIAYTGELGLDFDFGWGDPDHDFDSEYRGGRSGSWPWHDWNGWDIDDDPAWVLFLDAARVWSYGALPPEPDSGAALLSIAPEPAEALFDAGAGIRFGDLGIYVAVPLNDPASIGEQEPRFFIRLGRRF